MAITHLGEDIVASPTEDAETVAKLNVVYDNLRRALLSLSQWRFAIKRVTISKDPTQTTYGELNRYAIPGDLIKPIPPDRSIYEDDRFKQEGSYLISRKDNDLNVRYIFDETREDKWSPLFLDAFSIALAAKVAYDITGSVSKEQALQERAERAIKKAALYESVRDSADRIEGDELLNAHAGHYDRGNWSDAYWWAK